MPDFKHALSEEIRRIARKEIKQMLTPVLAKMSEMRKTISAQEKTIREMQKRDFASTAPAETPAVEKTAVAKIPRITQARIVKLREKLGLSQAEFSKLLGISLSTISHWETGKTAPRLEQKIRLAEIRDMGKHELEEMFKGKGITVQVDNIKFRTNKPTR